MNNGLAITIIQVVGLMALVGIAFYSIGYNQGYTKAYFKEQDMSTKANFISIDTKKKGGKK